MTTLKNEMRESSAVTELPMDQLDQVTGGFLPVLVAAALDGLSAGLWIGATIAVGYGLYKVATMEPRK
jgi:hypothetical protein